MQTAQKILVLFDVGAPVLLDHDYSEELKTKDWETEANVVRTLESLGYTCELLGIHDDIDLLRQKLESCRPELVFNLAEQFRSNNAYEPNIASFLELQGVAFTGCGSTGMTLCKHKGISKKILGYHRIRVPEFAVLPRSKRIVRPKRLHFPVFVKPLKTEASYGIAQASFVENDEQFKQRVAYIHERFNHDAIAEEYIDGRELYVSLLGNHQLQVLPIRELMFKQVPPDEPKFATFKAKWDEDYRQRWGIQNEFAVELGPKLKPRIERLCKKIYRLLAIDGYARLDLRLTPAQEIVFIEANPNPILAREEDFAQSAAKADIPYPALLEKILQLGRSAVRH